MADGTAIEWADASVNPIRARNKETGKVGWFCEHATPGCEHCYSEAINRRLGTGIDFKRQNRGRVELFLDEKLLTDPLRWRKPRRIFWNSMTDTFGEFVPNEFIDRQFAVMALTPQHTHLVLTKRAPRLRQYMTEHVKGAWAGRADIIDDAGNQCPMTDVQFRMNSVMCDLYPKVPPQALNSAAAWADEHYPDGDGFLRCWPLPNVWLGVSVEDQARADERIPDLLATPAAVHFISAEPLLGPVDLERISILSGQGQINALTGEVSVWVSILDDYQAAQSYQSQLDWVIAGAESGPGARECREEWVLSLKDQCVAACVCFFYKQAAVRGHKISTPELDGKKWVELPI